MCPSTTSYVGHETRMTHLTLVHILSLLYGFPPYESITLYLFNQLLMDIWDVFSNFSITESVAVNLFHMYSWGTCASFSLGYMCGKMTVGLEGFTLLPNYSLQRLTLYYLTANCFPKWLHPFALLALVYENSYCFILLATKILLDYLIFVSLVGM